MKWYNTPNKINNESQALHNAQNIVNLLMPKGWAFASICALCGNMYHESSINPDINEFSGGGGYGLVQWTGTSRTRLENWARSNGKNVKDPITQIEYIEYEKNNNLQWIPKSSYNNISFKNWTKNSLNKDVAWLTECFTWSYERPAVATANVNKRIAFARQCFQLLDKSGGGNDSPIINNDNTVIRDLNIDNIFNAFEDLTTNLGKVLENLLTQDLYKMDKGQFFTNDYFVIYKTMNNMFKIKPNLSIFNNIDLQPNTQNDIIFNDGVTNKPTGNTQLSQSDNENIKTMTNKANSYRTGSIKYSMYGARDMVSSGDCSSFVSHVLNAAGLKVGNGGTVDLYNIAKQRGWIVPGTDGFARDGKHTQCINKCQEGDYILMGKQPQFVYGGASHVVYCLSSSTIRHQTSSYGGYGPINSNTKSYINSLAGSGYQRWALCRPFGN